MDPITAQLLAAELRAERLRQVTRRQLIDEARRSSGAPAPITAGLGLLLVRVGTRLAAAQPPAGWIDRPATATAVASHAPLARR